MAVFWGVFQYGAASEIAETSEKPKQGKFAEANKPNLPKQISRSKENFWELQLERVRFSVETNRSVFCSSWILRLAKSFSPPPNRASAEAPLVSGRGRRARALYHSVPTTHTQVQHHLHFLQNQATNTTPTHQPHATYKLAPCLLPLLSILESQKKILSKDPLDVARCLLRAGTHTPPRNSCIAGQ